VLCIIIIVFGKIIMNIINDIWTKTSVNLWSQNP